MKTHHEKLSEMRSEMNENENELVLPSNELSNFQLDDNEPAPDHHQAPLIPDDDETALDHHQAPLIPDDNEPAPDHHQAPLIPDDDEPALDRDQYHLTDYEYLKMKATGFGCQKDKNPKTKTFKRKTFYCVNQCGASFCMKTDVQNEIIFKKKAHLPDCLEKK